MSTVTPTDKQISGASGPTFTEISSGRKTMNTFMTFIMWACMIVALIPLAWVLWTVLSNGIGAVTDIDWWTKDQTGTIRILPGGGALHAIVGTLVQTFIASIVSIPLGIFTAIYLVEYAQGGWLGRLTTFMVDILSGVPSIVAALFIYTLWITVLGQQRSGFAVALSLILLMLPIVVRNTEEMLRVVPMDLREASYALGVPKWKTIVRIVLPTALSGIVTGVMLAVARVMGESAPVLVLVGSTSTLSWNPFGGPQSSLPLMMLEMYKAGTTDVLMDKLWGAALTLVILVVSINLVARLIAAKFSVKK
ncbi:phosphate ABC transporter permease PstA [Corynebacterium cystitidis]|uniref:Phosphate transport system permease protein PstA n=1 Tax=Corynebacterium cystitidis DSM 20524 TaxID=1121357 RepID=A0A1H9W2I1_9CORY|nr:phosphate ABC transporter permease PstA [Corynebacterium cystitidis]WJY82990.1 Phosphate transport system permease protein PstA [Corynebacterium cystitidis DSM 20524]SES27877.1 phosphate transport system permease protein [Corynebacterium cystitidis DSM 20524]SNV64612.1 phosphate ABC transporter permease [Corynebacterium cystitidis]